MPLRFVLLMTKKARPTAATKSSGSFQPCRLPSDTIMAASYECHDELPRWLNIGVETGPLRLCILGLLGGPARILRLVRSRWKA